MNKRAFLWAGFVTTTLVVCAKTTFVTSVFALLVMGVIPGTTFTIPAWVMLIAYPVIFLATVTWFSTQSLLIGERASAVKKPARKPAVKRTRTKASMRRKITATKRRARATV